jgi:ABC-type multidrug transport system fused ATPase/permease subunit
MAAGGGSKTSTGDGQKPTARKTLETKEAATQGGVKWSTYGAYLSAAAGPWAASGIAFIFIFGALLILASSIWLSVWAGLTPAQQHLPENEWYAVVYGCIVAVAVVVCLIRMWLFFAAAVGAGQKLHDRALAAVLGAPLRWFEQNPVGRIVSRFSKDLYFIDTLLPLTLEDFVNIMTLIISAVVLVVVTNAWLLLAVAPLTALLLWLRNYYLKTSRQVQRIEAISRSPIFRMLVESLDGLDSVRAYGLQSLLSDRMARIVDANMSNFFMFLTTSRWLGTRLDVCCSIFLAAASIGTVLVRDGARIDPGLAGLSLSMVIQLTGVLQWCFRQSAMLEVQMVSVERLLELEAIEPEGVRVGTAQELLEDAYPAGCMGVGCCGASGPSSSAAAAGEAPSSASAGALAKRKSQVTALPWPTTGMVEFRNVWLRYRPGLPYVLRGVSFGVPPGALVGVIGRTGAGKTTLTAALLRLVQHETTPPAGTDDASEMPDDAPASDITTGIVVGGDDVRSVHLTALRRGIAVIDQDPTLFAGTLRSNVDPFDDYADSDILDALRAVQLLEATTTRGGLQARIEEGGSNLSVGERQLLCLARNVLRSVRVQVYDEPTAFSDVRTDEKLQAALRVAAAASKSTVFTVAHRLRTVADHNLLIVMDAGRVEEFGSPAWLLDMEHAAQGPKGAWGYKRTGAFRSLVGQLGEAEAKAVQDLAAGEML